MEFASSKSSPELAFGGLEGTVARRLALVSPQALLSALLWGDIQNQEKKGGCRAKVEVAGCYSVELPACIFKYGEVPETVCPVHPKGA